MDEERKQALAENHQKLRTGIIVKNILPALRRYLEPVEYSLVEDKPGNVAQVDELVKILLTKEDTHFDGFCRVLERNGFHHCAKQLRADAGVRQEQEDSEVLDADQDLMAEKDCFYYVDIEELDDKFYGDLLKSIDTFVLEASHASFQHFRRETERVLRHRRHVTSCDIQLSRDRTVFLDEIQGKYALWKNNLEYQSLREVIVRCRDEDLMKALQQYENQLRAKGETIIYNCKKQKQMNNGLYLKLKAKHETTLATLMRMQEFLVTDVGLDDAIFDGFREGCIELYFNLSPETASISMVPLRSDASRSKLLRLGVSRVELSGHWVIDTASGRVTYLMTPQNDWLTEDSDRDVPSDEATQHESGSSEKFPHFKRLPRIEDCPPSKRTKLIFEDEYVTPAASEEVMQCLPEKISQNGNSTGECGSDLSADEATLCIINDDTEVTVREANVEFKHDLAPGPFGSCKEVETISDDEVMPSVVPTEMVQCSPVKTSKVSDHSPFYEERDSDVLAGEEEFLCSENCHLAFEEAVTSHECPAFFQPEVRKRAHRQQIRGEEQNATIEMASGGAILTETPGSPNFNDTSSHPPVLGISTPSSFVALQTAGGPTWMLSTPFNHMSKKVGRERSPASPATSGGSGSSISVTPQTAGGGLKQMLLRPLNWMRKKVRRNRRPRRKCPRPTHLKCKLTSPTEPCHDSQATLQCRIKPRPTHLKWDLMRCSGYTLPSPLVSTVQAALFPSAIVQCQADNVVTVHHTDKLWPRTPPNNWSAPGSRVTTPLEVSFEAQPLIIQAQSSKIKTVKGSSPCVEEHSLPPMDQKMEIQERDVVKMAQGPSSSSDGKCSKMEISSVSLI